EGCARVTTAALNHCSLQRIRLPRRDSQSLRSLADRALRLQSADRPDVRHVRLPIGVTQILEHHLTLVVWEVQVNVRKIVAGLVNKSLKHQVVNNRIYLGDV